jgi:hypothetical protein
MKSSRFLKIFLVASLLLLVASCIAISVFFKHKCGSNKEAVARAKSLSENELQVVFMTTQSLEPGYYCSADEKIANCMPIPDQLAALNPKSIRRERNSALIHLAGCADDKSELMIRGLDSGKGSIDLAPGEAQFPIPLWKQ